VAKLVEEVKEAVKAPEPAAETAPEPEAKAEPVAAPEPEPEPAAEAETAPEPREVMTEEKILKLTEAKMMGMDTAFLTDIAKQVGIDVNATLGRNTNKKVRELILDWQDSIKAPASPRPESPSGNTPDGPMDYSEAKNIVSKYFIDVPCSAYGTRRKGCQAMMLKFGAFSVNEDGAKIAKFSALRDKGEDYRPLVAAIRQLYPDVK
jgi:pyruvate/2-oxoglutarate dehydrogenase complex dihydrolipoamide acyltransferase (E2) component